jgi:hypothetical protein
MTEIADLPVGTHAIYDSGNRRVEVEWIGEGVDGDFDPSDPEDYPHLRFNVMEYCGDEWEQIDDTSYCCQVDARSSDEVKLALAKLVLDTVGDDPHPKRACERLSWTTLADVEAAMAASAPRM